MSSSDLFAQVKVLAYKAPENARPITNANVSKHQDQQSHSYRNGNRTGNRGAFRGRFKGGQRGYQSGNRGGSRGRFNRGRGGFSNFGQRHFSNRNVSNDDTCRYCKNRGHSIDQCFKKQWADRQWRKDSTPNPPRNYFNGTQTADPTSNPTPWIANVSVYSATSTTTTDPYSWMVDSAANAYIQPFKHRIDNYQPFANIEEVKGLGGKLVKALGSGTVTLTDSQRRKRTLQNVLYVPEAKAPILSFMKLRHEGINVYFTAIDEFTLLADSFALLGYANDDILRVHESCNDHEALITTRSQFRRQTNEQENDEAALEQPIEEIQSSERRRVTSISPAIPPSISSLS